MNRFVTGVLLLTGSLLLAPAPITADPTDGFIVSESLRRRYNGLPPRYTPSTPKRYKYEGKTFTTPSGASTHRYKYSDGLGNTYKGKIETFPGGAYRHRGSWK